MTPASDASGTGASAQDILNASCARIISQDGPCFLLTEYGYRQCRLRHEGKACAVGAVVPDERYTPEMEAQVMRDVLGCVPGLDDHGELLLALQQAHDHVCFDTSTRPQLFFGMWSERVRAIAGERSLDADAALAGCPA